MSPLQTTSSARPAAPWEGQTIYDTDTNIGYQYDGTNFAPTYPGSGFRNLIINGNFNINQRGFSSGSNNAYSFDRWFPSFNGGFLNHTPQSFTAGNAISGQEPTTWARLTSSTQSSASHYCYLAQRIEDVRSCAGQTIAVSLWLKTSSATSVALSVDQNFGSGGSATVSTHVGKTDITTSWARYSFTITVPSISGKTIGSSSYLQLNIWQSAGSDFNAVTNSLGTRTGTIDIWGVQLERNLQPTPFEQRPIGVELALCQRYYENSYDNGVAIGTLSATGSTAVIYSSASGAGTGFRFMVRKRVTPAVRGYPYTTGTNNGVGYWTSASDATNRAVTFGNISPNGMRYFTLTGATVNSWYEGHYEADAEL